MIRRIAMALALAGASTAIAQVPSTSMTPDQKGYVAYHYCMMQAAMDASKTAAKDDEVYAIAHAKCAATRKSVLSGQDGNAEFVAALDAADAEKKANFPAWIKGVRERRVAREAEFGK
jgi:hypothetical protein